MNAQAISMHVPDKSDRRQNRDYPALPAVCVFALPAFRVLRFGLGLNFLF